jgi:hypothetical protein
MWKEDELKNQAITRAAEDVRAMPAQALPPAPPRAPPPPSQVNNQRLIICDPNPGLSFLPSQARKGLMAQVK